MSDKSGPLRAKKDDPDARSMKLPFGFSRSSATASLLVAQMARTIQRSSRLAVALERENGITHSAVTGR